MNLLPRHLQRSFSKMASDFGLDMNYSDYSILVADNDVKEIKKILLSRDRDQILWVIDKIKELTTDGNILLYLIRVDIPEYLCDAIDFMDIVSTRCVYSCLEEMMQFQEFFAHNHASYAMDSLLKGLFMLIKNNSNDMIVKEALSLLIMILHGFGKHDVSPGKGDVEKAILLLPEIFKNEIPVEIKIHIGFYLEKILSFKIDNLDGGSREIILRMIIQWFSCWEQIRMTLTPEEFLILNCSLAENILRFLMMSELEEMDEESDLKTEIHSNVVRFLIEIAAPYIADGFVQSNVNSKILGNFLQALIYAMEEMPSEKSKISQKISCMGFLLHLTRILSFSEISDGSNLPGLSLDLLSRILLALSDDVFEFPEMWQAGRENFQREMINGISILPSDASTWLDCLTDQNGHPSSKLVLAVYLYFYLLCSKNLNATGNIYPAVVNFVNFSTEIICQPLFVKAVWFLFAASQWSKSQISPSEETNLATELIVKLLESEKNIELIYTHHPAMLYWSISSELISPEIQNKTIECWIRNTHPNCEILSDFVKNNPDAQKALISILENCEGPIVESSFSTLKKLITDMEYDDIIQKIWPMIPPILSNYLTDAAKVINADYVIELASLKTPKNPDMAISARTATFLTEILTNSNLLSLIPCFKLAFQLLESSWMLRDQRVATVYLRAPGFLQKIADGINLKSSEMAVLCLKIFTILLKMTEEFEEFSTIKDVTKVKLKIKNLMQILSKNDHSITPAALELFQELLKSNFKSPIYTIKFQNYNQLEILYHHLQNIIIKDPPETKNLAWSCLKHCLQLTPAGAVKIVKNLISNPWTHDVIRFAISNSHDSPEMREFLTVWINMNAPFEEFLLLPDLSIGDGFFAETVKFVAEASINGKLSPDQLLSREILGSNVNLSLEIRELLDKMM